MGKRRLTTVLAIILTLVPLIVGCSYEVPQVGKRAPDFKLLDLKRETIYLSDLWGRPVLLNFWATWCPPCRQELPLIQAIFEKWSAKGLLVLTIDIGEDDYKVRDFMQSGNLSFPVLLDVSREVSLSYNIRAVPTTFFIDKDGIIQVIKVGAFFGLSEIERNLSKIIS